MSTLEQASTDTVERTRGGKRVIRAALYARISDDKKGEAAGVETQIRSATHLANARDWLIADTYIDNDLSATVKGVVRPHYERLLKDIAAGKIDSIVCYHSDRLQRTIPDLVRLIEVGKDKGINIQCSNGASFDLSTSDGRMLAYMLTAVATAEVEHKLDRQLTANRSRVEAGQPLRHNRTFGYERDGSIRDSEAYYVAEIFARFAAGSGTNVIARWLEENHIRAPRSAAKGLAFHRVGVRHILRNRRYLGELHYREELIRTDLPALIDPALFQVVQHRLDSRKMTGNKGNAKRHLGSGLYRCAICGGPLETKSNMIAASRAEPVRRYSQSYHCRINDHVFRQGAPIDALVERVIIERLRSDAVRQQFAGDRHSAKAMALRSEVVMLTADKDRALGDYKAKHIEGPEYADTVAPIKARLLAITREQAEIGRASALAEILGSDDPGAAWRDHRDIHVRTAVVDELAVITICKAAYRGQPFTEDAVTVAWRTEADSPKV